MPAPKTDEDDDQGYFEWLLSKGVQPDHADAVRKPGTWNGAPIASVPLPNKVQVLPAAPAAPNPLQAPDGDVNWSRDLVRIMDSGVSQEEAIKQLQNDRALQVGRRESEWDARYGGGAERVEQRPNSRTYHYPLGVPYSELTIGANGKIMVVPRGKDPKIGAPVNTPTDPELLRYAMSR
jgi:hypothetical protein